MSEDQSSTSEPHFRTNTVEEIIDDLEELEISDDDTSGPFLKEKHLGNDGKPLKKRSPKKKEGPEIKLKRDDIERRFRNDRSSGLNDSKIEEVDGEPDLDFRTDSKVAEDEAGNKDSTGLDDSEENFSLEERFDPEEEKKLLEEAEQFKTKGNKWFKQGHKQALERAINRYDSALKTCPDYLHKQRAIYWSNKSACYLKLDEYQKAVDSASQALGLDPEYVKALNRRATANEKLNKWSNLQAAADDYTKLVEIHGMEGNFTERDRARKNGVELESRIKEAATTETQEMLGKLKDIGNSFLGKFGMSTDMFNMAPDGKGGYSMNIGGDKDGKKE